MRSFHRCEKPRNPARCEKSWYQEFKAERQGSRKCSQLHLGARLFLVQQVLDEADAVVAKNHIAAILRGVQVDVGKDLEVAVVFLVADHLAHMPHMGFLLVGFVQEKIRGGSGIGVQQNLFMRLEVRVDNLAPAPKAVAPLAVELGQRLGVFGREQAHALEEER